VIAVDDTYLRTPENLDDGDFPADVDVIFHLAALSSRSMHEKDT
jgi:UDP-glucose 4-epimerase